MLSNYQEKDFTGSVKDIDIKNRVITGYFSSFRQKDDTPDHDGDIILPGAFTKTLSERGPEGSNQIFFLNQHNWNQPHGKLKVLKEDNYGLYFESDKMPNTTYSNDAIELYSRGIVKEHSFGFQVMKHDPIDGGRIIKEIKMYEGSNVTLGADSRTPFGGFKSKTPKEVNAELKKFLKAYREGTFQDEKVFGLLEIAIQQLQKQAVELAVFEYKKSLELTKPQTSTSAEKSIAEQINLFTKKLSNEQYNDGTGSSGSVGKS